MCGITLLLWTNRAGDVEPRMIEVGVIGVKDKIGQVAVQPYISITGFGVQDERMLGTILGQGDTRIVRLCGGGDQDEG